MFVFMPQLLPVLESYRREFNIIWLAVPVSFVLSESYTMLKINGLFGFEIFINMDRMGAFLSA